MPKLSNADYRALAAFRYEIRKFLTALQSIAAGRARRPRVGASLAARG
jgi:hypothetical protein